MKLNHLDLQVPDVQEAAAFFERWFGFRRTSNPASPALVFLEGDDGFVLVFQRSKDGAPYPEGFHVGFLVDTPADVVAFHARAKKAGLTLGDVVTNGRGTMIYFVAPGGILVEVSARAKKPTA